MKKSILSFCAALSLAVCSYANVLTVSNNTALPGSPGQYTSIGAAITAAVNGDTILVQGSPIAYNENPTVTKSLTFIGPGYNPQTSTGYVANIVGYFTFSNTTVYPVTNSSNSKLIGLTNIGVRFGGSVALSNITISRCQNWGSGGQNGAFYLSGGVSGVTIEDCIFYCNLDYYDWQAITVNGSTNVVIRNNIFREGGKRAIYGNNSTTVIVRNNLFLTGNTGIINLSNSIIENNIFYCTNRNSQTNLGQPITNVTTSTFNNNYCYYADTLLLVSPSSVGSGNINNYTNIYNNWDCFLLNSAFTYGAEFWPKTTSVVHNAGTDGTDIGPTGGTSPIYIAPAPYPLTGEPPVPEVQNIIMPVSSVPAGGTLNVTVKAKKIN